MTILKSNSAFAARGFALFSETTSQLASATGSLAWPLVAPSHRRRAKVAQQFFHLLKDHLSNLGDFL